MNNKFFSFQTIYNLFKHKINSTKIYKSASINKKFFTPLILTPFIFTKSILFSKEDKKKDSNVLDFKDIIRGEYENKIRTFSSIEKRFLIFSRVKSTEDIKMTYYQFLDSVVPFQYMKTLPEAELIEILKNNNIFENILSKVIDINSDGFISFEEFVIWSTLISLNTNTLKLKYPSGEISREDFIEYLIEFLNSFDVLKVTDKTLVDARMIKSDTNTIHRLLVEFVAKYFTDVKINIDKDIEKLIAELNLIMLLYEVIFLIFYISIFISFIEYHKKKKILLPGRNSRRL